MNPLVDLRSAIHRRFPTAKVNLDQAPLERNGVFLDVELNGLVATVEWRPGQGFGISTGDVGYGEGPELVLKDLPEVERWLGKKLASVSRSDCGPEAVAGVS
jgi:hypothetical protein